MFREVKREEASWERWVLRNIHNFIVVAISLVGGLYTAFRHIMDDGGGGGGHGGGGWKTSIRFHP